MSIYVCKYPGCLYYFYVYEMLIINEKTHPLPLIFHVISMTMYSYEFLYTGQRYQKSNTPESETKLLPNLQI